MLCSEKKKPPEFYGVWGRIQAEFLKREHPAIYQHLMKSGELMEYLEGYQWEYSKHAAELDAVLSKERRLDDVQMERDLLRWIVLTGQIHLDVLRRMKAEIQR